MSVRSFNQFRTIKGKITILYVLVFGITLLIGSIALYTIFAHRLRADFDQSMISVAASLAESIHEDGIVPQEIFQDLSEDYSSLGYGDRLFLEILDKNKSIVLKSPQLGDAGLTPKPNKIAKAFLGKPVFTTTIMHLPSSDRKRFAARLLLYPVTANSSPEYILAIAKPTIKMERVLLHLRLIFFTLIPFVIFVAAFGGWFLANRAFRPVNQLISATHEITAESLHKRLTIGSVDDEINRLSITLNEMIERLEQSFHAQKQFTADASHELRTPLTILAGEIEVARQHDRTPDEYQRILQSNLEEIRRLQKIVNALLLLSRIESGKMKLGRNPVRIDELFISAIQKVNSSAKSQGITIDLQLEDGGGENSSEILVIADSASLQNVFLNLLDNAVRFSKPGSKVSCRLKVINDQVEITVEDRGEGISPEHIGHVFDRFYRVDHSSGNASKSGAGLGLAIAKTVVEAHGGTISIKSSPGQGTIVRVILPIADKET